MVFSLCAVDTSSGDNKSIVKIYEKYGICYRNNVIIIVIHDHYGLLVLNKFVKAPNEASYLCCHI